MLIAGEPDVGSHHRQFHKFTAIDDCTRLRVLRIYDRCNQQTAIQFADYVLERLAFRVEVIQTDNGVEFGASFYWHVLDKGAGHVYIKPRTPRRNGKVERSHRIDAEEFYRLLDGVVIDDTEVFNDKLQEGVGELLQLPPAPRWPGRPDPLRATQATHTDPDVSSHRQLHTTSGPITRSKSSTAYCLH